MRLSDYVIQFLRDSYKVDTFFTLSGGGSIFLMDSLGTVENIKYYSKPENWKRLNTKERASLYSDIDSLDYIQKQVPEVGENPYPNADSLPYVEMRRAYKMWLNKKK